MMQRVTLDGQTAVLLAELQRDLAAVNESAVEVGTGLRVRAPSDDPAAAADAVQLSADARRIASEQAAADAAVSWADASQAALTAFVQQLGRARTLGVEGANQALGSTQLAAIANELDQIIHSLVSVANTQFAGRFLFAGTLTTSASLGGSMPFTYVTGTPDSVVYAGNTGQVTQTVGPGDQVVVNVDGTVLLPAFSVLIDLRDAVRSNNFSQIETDLGTIDSVIDSITSAQARLGAAVQHAQAQKNALSQLAIAVDQTRSNRVDADMPSAITAAAQSQTVYQAALAAAGMVQRLGSLFDYLR
jgi:flagellar hook-associated protein 3 FlgL